MYNLTNYFEVNSWITPLSKALEIWIWSVHAGTDEWICMYKHVFLCVYIKWNMADCIVWKWLLTLLSTLCWKIGMHCHSLFQLLHGDKMRFIVIKWLFHVCPADPDTGHSGIARRKTGPPKRRPVYKGINQVVAQTPHGM